MLYEIQEEPLIILKKDKDSFVEHAHRELEILICVEGKMCVTCNFQEKTLLSGQAMFAFSNDIHSYAENLEGDGVMIIVDPLLLGNFVPEPRRNNFVLSCDQTLVKLANDLYEEYRKQSDMQICVGYLHIIIGKLLKELGEKRFGEFFDDKVFSKVLRYLSENYTKTVSLRSTCAEFGLSEGYLSRAFNEKIGKSFVSYLHVLRVGHAKNLLVHSQKNVIEIAYESGFSDQCTFNRVFKKITGTTPSEYRKTER